MSRRETFQDLSLPTLKGEMERWRWLYAELRAAILDGRLKRGSRMPSTRNLAAQYGLARGTVVSAFDHLESEGYIEAHVGTGSFVAARLPDDSIALRKNLARPRTGLSRADLSKRGRKAQENILLLPPSRSVGKAFRSYEPAIDLFPVNLWARVAGRVLRRAPRSLYGQGDAQGYLPLRRAISEYLGAVRGVRSTAGQILITSGAQQALDLVCRMLLDDGDQAWVEDPGYPGAVFALKAAGARIVPVPVDEGGLRVEWGRRRAPHAKLAYVTPANQMPLGVAMPLERRLALLKWAMDEGAWIVEDEYDAEYRYSGRPLAALQGLDQSGTVIYIGTFTKMLFNSLRIGFLVLPERLVEPFTKVRSFVDRHPPTLEQAVLAEFITEGHFGHHVRRMRQVYGERMAVLADAARQKLDGLLEVPPAVAGMRTVGRLKTGETDISAAQRARSQGLEVAAVTLFALRQPSPNGLILGFAGSNPAELRRGVDVLASVLASRQGGFGVFPEIT